MTTTRETHKIKVYNFNDNGDKNPNIWIEVERLDKLIVETGKGPSYQKTVYHFLWENEQDDGTWDGSADRTKIKRIKNPGNGAQYIDLPVIEYVDVETGKGPKYQRSRHHFDNSDENNSRVTHPKTVIGSDHVSRLEVEVIDKIIREYARGPLYIKTVVSYNDQGDEQGATA